MSASTTSAAETADDRALDQRLFVISGSNTWVHIYPDVQSMLNCKDTTVASPGPLEFFDINGRRLAPVIGSAWTLEDLRATTDPANEGLVQDRLCRVIDSIRSTLEQRLAQEPDPPATLEVALAELPDLAGKSLPQCYTLLEASHFCDPIIRDPGSAWHVFWCH